jgi:predicted transcriptional regulator
MRFESEVISEEVLPAIRSILASKLQQEYGFMQKEIAYKLELTQPAVSQYLNGSRANQDVINKLQDDPQIDILLNDAAGKIAQGKDYDAEISSAVQAIKDKGLLKEKFEDTKKL